MTTLIDFQKYCAERPIDFCFDSLTEMIGGAEKVFESYLEGSLDQALKDWVLMDSPYALAAFTMVQLARFEASSFFSIMGMLNQINLNLKDIKAGMASVIQPAKVQ